MRSLGMGIVLAGSIAALCPATAFAQRGDGWELYQNPRFGFRLLYPADVFQPETQREEVPDVPPEEEAEPDYRPPQGGVDGQDDLDGGAEDAGDENGLTLESADRRAKLVAYATWNSENFTPSEYRNIFINEFEGYDRITYGPRGQTWFVLSGYRGDDIYYQKVMFSCGGRVINALSITFPAKEKPFYEPIVERIEDNFRPVDVPGCRTGRP